MGKISASPTKEFFINMLTRDIALDRAILDLVDNSVDAAISNNDYQDKRIDITLNKEYFSIADNCGGFSEETAESYAFRFGRDQSAPKTPNSVGQFGVGMKRTLFKIGKQFEVISRHKDSSFKVSVNVNDWMSDPTPDWSFDLEKINNDSDEFGTEIIVTNIESGVSDQFDTNIFVIELMDEIKKAHFKAISNGINIYVNNEPVNHYNINIKKSDDIVPFYKTIEVNDVTVKIICGIGERDLNEGGWYIVCNGRLVEESEQTDKTGWRSGGLPKYHANYAFFRGVVDFEAEDSSKLPWTTTKTGVDVDNPIYRRTLLEMQNAIRQVTNFLKDREKEVVQLRDEMIEETPLNDAIEDADLIDIYSVDVTSNFCSPEPAEITSKNPTVTVNYKVLKSKMEKVKYVLNLSSAAKVGEHTFNYYFDYECDDE